MIEWCERNGLDARRIPDRNDAITISDDLAQSHVALIADVVYIFGPDDDHVPHYPDAVAKFGDGYDRVEITRRVPVDSEPPLNPEWVALFGKEAAYRREERMRAGTATVEDTCVELGHAWGSRMFEKNYTCQRGCGATIPKMRGDDG